MRAVHTAGGAMRRAPQVMTVLCVSDNDQCLSDAEVLPLTFTLEDSQLTLSTLQCPINILR